MPELAAFDAHNAYLLAGGFYQGALREPLGELAMHEYISGPLSVLSRALLLAGCYTESYLAMPLKVDTRMDDSLSDLKLAASAAFESASAKYNDTQTTSIEIEEYMLVPVIRDGLIRVVKYPFIPQNLFDMQEATIQTLNTELGRLSNGLCLIKKEAAPDTDSTARTRTDRGYSIYITSNVPQGTALFSETTDLHADAHPYRELLPCKYCLRDIPNNDVRQQSFCNNTCAKKFSRFVHVPEELLRSVLANTVQWWRRNPGRHPLEAPGISCLAAEYGGSISLSYCHHIAVAVALLESRGIDLFTDAVWNSAVFMNILARVQHSARAFDINVENEEVAVSRLLPFISEGNVANVEATWALVANGAAVTIVAGRDLVEGEELVVGAV